MSYARHCRGSRVCLTDLSDTPAGWVQVPIFAPGTISVAALQIAANRLAPGYPPPGLAQVLLGAAPGEAVNKLIDIDGVVGPQTLDTMKAIVKTENIAPETAASADLLMQQLNQIADARGLPALQLQPVGPFAKGDPAAPPAPPAGTRGVPPAGMSMTTIAIGAVGAGVLFALAMKKKGRR